MWSLALRCEQGAGEQERVTQAEGTEGAGLWRGPGGQRAGLDLQRSWSPLKQCGWVE